MKKIFYLAFIVFIFSGCTPGVSISQPDFSKVSLGMKKEDVIRGLGQPSEISVKGRVEYFTYGWDHPWDGRPGYIVAWYYVKFVDGRVDSYGKKGDFNSTKNKTVDLNINKKSNIKVEEEDSAKDLYTELMKLNDLKKEGIITDKEFKTLKTKLLNSN